MLKRCCLLALLFLQPVWGDNNHLFVRNKPFKGVVTGSVENPSTLQADVAELSRAFDLYQGDVNGNWVVRRTAVEPLPTMVSHAGQLYVLGEPLDFELVDGKRLVNVAEFARRVGARLRPNKELGTLDVDLLKDPTQEGTAVIPGIHHLVFFGADWAPASRLYKPVMQQFERKHIMPVVFVDCTQPRSVNYRTYIRHFKGDKLPYTVLLNPAGREVKSWTGYQDLGALTTEILKLVNTKKGS